MYYDYEELKNNALRTNSDEDVEKLAAWFERFGADYWNGEYFEIDKNHSLCPVYNSDFEIEKYIIR